MFSPPLILSIQSHVAFGHVGNAAAVFPLQLLGVKPVVIHTVQFSNHTGYGAFTGQVFSAEHIRDLLAGLTERGMLNDCQAVLSGYLGDASIGSIIVETVRNLRKDNAKLLYLCDPVMGDVGRGIFVKEEIPTFISQSALQYATIITPNQFEFEMLTGEGALQTVEQTITKARSVLAQHPQMETIIITSLRTPDIASNGLATMAITRSGAYMVQTPYIELEPLPNGMGDVFSAIFLAHTLHGKSIAVALQATVSSLYSLVAKTTPGTRDLPLIREQTQISVPEQQFPLHVMA